MNNKMEALKLGINSKIEDFLKNSDELKAFIEFRKANFYNYSIRNTILIYKQNPLATFVAGFRKWRELGYKVKKGAKAIQILIPLIRNIINDRKEVEEDIYGYKYVNVFDKSQVEATENAVKFPEINIEMKISEDFKYTPMRFYRAVKRCIEQYAPIELKKTFYDDKVMGETDGKTIFIKKLSNRIDMAATMVHEFIHYNCHFNLGNKKSLTVSQEETEAEIGALILGTHFDLDVSGQYKYLSTFRKGIDLEKSFSKVLKVMEKIIYGSEDKKGIEEIIKAL